MPMVGKKKFAYSEKGEKEAKEYGKKKGMPVTIVVAVGKQRAMPQRGRGWKGEEEMKQGLYANINAKQARIKAGSGEKMRKVGSKGAPTAEAFRQSAKTAKKPKKVK